MRFHGVEVGKYIQNGNIATLILKEMSIWLFPTAKSQLTDNQDNRIGRTVSAKLEEWSTSPKFAQRLTKYTSHGPMAKDADPAR
jgi:hypothetical protein